MPIAPALLAEPAAEQPAHPPLCGAVTGTAGLEPDGAGPALDAPVALVVSPGAEASTASAPPPRARTGVGPAAERTFSGGSGPLSSALSCTAPRGANAIFDAGFTGGGPPPCPGGPPQIPR